MSLKSIYRTNTCGELRASHASHNVKLSGWVARIRDHGGVAFVDLRDNYGLTQIVIPQDLIKSDEGNRIKVESVISVEGVVVLRGETLTNTKIPTGEIEVKAEKVEILSEANVLPFQITDNDPAPEYQRLKYRFLDLRNEDLHKNILMRSAIIRKIREVMHNNGFVEFQTPILTASSPEGARDFIVPSRLHPGKFYALPQAPQQFKQLLMVSGFDRYFQIAPCFRDENARADRSPGEFYQLDFEMSFVEQDDVLKFAEQMMYEVFTAFTDKPVTKPNFPRISYNQALEQYGTDKPDMRVPYLINQVTEIFKSTEFKIFQNALADKKLIHAIPVEYSDALPSRKYFDDLIEWYKANGGAGLCYLVFDGVNFKSGEVKGNIAKNVKPEELEALKQKFEIGNKKVVLYMACEDKLIKTSVLGKLRTKLGEDTNKVEDAFKFCYVVDFPMYEWNDEENKIDFGHNPFSMPQGGLDALNNKDPLDIYAYLYDIVCNGYELSTGAIRNHTPEIMYRAFEIVGHTKEDVDTKFGGMINAFKYGAPPHGGMAPGIDRIVMLLCGQSAIRDVIAFPMAQSAEDLMMGAPSTVTEKQLREVHIKIKE